MIHKILHDLLQADYEIAAPESGDTVYVDRQFAVIPVTTGAGAFTLTLGQPTRAGLFCTVDLKTDGGGDLTLTVTGGYDAAAQTTITFGDAGDWVMFYSIDVDGSYYWRVLNATAGVAEISAELSEVIAATAFTVQIGLTDQVKVTDGTIEPITTNDVDLGSASKLFKNLFAVSIDAGMSGVAGSVDVFPTTESKGKASITCTDQAGDTTVSIIVGAMAAARTINLPDPGATSYLMQSTAQITLAEADVLDDALAGTVVASKAVVVDASKDIGEFNNIGYTGTLNNNAGDSTPVVAIRFGQSVTEGLEIKVYDEVIQLTNAVFTDTTLAIPAGAVILSVQVNLEDAITGDGSGDNLFAKIGIGISGGDEDGYGNSDALTQNTKIDTIPDWSVNSGETLALFALKTDGNTAATEKFTGGATQDVRVRVVYAENNSLDNV